MPDNTSNIVFPQSGIISDVSLQNMESKYYSFALNAMVADKSGEEPSLQNEMSNICAVKFPESYRVVGFIEVPEQNRTIYLLTNPVTGHGQVGEVHNCNHIKDRTDRIEKVFCKDCQQFDSPELPPLEKQVEKCYCTYRSIAPGDCLGFDINYPIDIEYRITSCSLNIYFTDALNERRYMYFDYANNDINDDLVLQDAFKVQTGVSGPCDTPVYSDQIDCDKIKVHPDYKRVCIDFINFVNGGNLKEGTYQVLIARSDAYGNVMSSYFPSTQIIPLFRKPITFETNLATASALHFKIDNLQAGGYYNLVIAETIDGFTQLKYIGTFPTSQNEYTYTGFETSIRVLAPEEVFFRYPYYQTAKSVTKANSYLFYGGVKSYKKLNLQPIANAITLQWLTVALKEGAYKDPRNTFNFRSEQRDEVVPYGIIFEMTNGEETCAFHIPGRASISGDLTSIPTTDPDYISDFNCITPTSKPKWKLFNTGTVIGTPHEYNQDCETDKCWEYGSFSYWESTDTYPNIPEVWGSLCNQPIRHHKFPDSCISHIHDSGSGAKTYNENNYIFPIGVTVNHAGVVAAIAAAVITGTITQADADRIASYRIVRGNRLGQKSIIAKGLFYNMWFYDKFGVRYYYPNYVYNDLHSDPFLSPTPNYLNGNDTAPIHMGTDHIDFSRYTFHSPDTHFVQPELGSYIKIETEEYGESEGYFTYSDCEARHKLLSTAARALAFGLGLAAALSATGKKDCRVVTYKSEYKTNQNDSRTFSDSDGLMPYSNVHGNFTSGSGTLSTDEGIGIDFQLPTTHETHPEIKEDHNFQTAQIFDDCGQEISDGDQSESYTKNYCHGQAWQYFNCNLIINGVIDIFVGVLASIVQRTILGIIEMNKVIETMRELIPFKNYGIQYDSIGKYNNYTCVAPGNKNRTILRGVYLDPVIQAIDEVSTVPNATSTTIKVNNWHRESSVYLKLDGTNLVAPTVLDNSRVRMEDVGLGYGHLDEHFNRTISSYYGSIKRDIPNQYGDLCTIDYMETNNCSFFVDQSYTTCEAKVFGGDTYINRFSLKRKMPFWIQTRCTQPDGTDVKYSELANVAYPNYYLNVEEPLVEKLDSIGGGGGIGTLITELLGTADSRFDDRTAKFFYQNGYMHLYHYGVPSFIVESDVNVDYRHGEDNKEKDFYPHQTDLKYWFEEANVPIKFDNTYFYNRTYSKQNHETPDCTSCIRTLKDLTCNTHDDNLVIYSEQNEQERKNDNWLVFKANNFYNFPLTNGKLITVDGIEEDKILVRMENTSLIFNAFNTLQATPENIQVGTGGIFATRPQEFSNTSLGYAGTQHRDILHTEFGHIFPDAKRGNVLSIAPGGGGLDELTKYGVSHWFKENLPFQLKKDFPMISDDDFDNNLKGIGLHMCFDKRYNRMLLTKLDYKVVNKDVKYDTTLHMFYIIVDDEHVEVKVYDPRYFCNKSWTRSYNFATKGWTSFHTYKPNFYIEHIDGFESAHTYLTNLDDTLIDQQKTYLHNVSNKSYQVFYGKLQPFIIELIGKQSIDNNFLDSFEYSLDTIRYHNEFDAYYNNDKTFNKAIVYNERQCSGMLNLVVNNHDDLSQLGIYPAITDKGFEILTTNSENVWSFNDFGDITVSQYNNMPYFIYDCANVNKVLDNRALDYFKNTFDVGRMRQKMCKVRLINDKESRYKMIFNFGQVNQTQSRR